MNFMIRLLGGASIALLTFLACRAVPHYAGPIGWLGATLYFILIVNRHCAGLPSRTSGRVSKSVRSHRRSMTEGLRPLRPARRSGSCSERAGITCLP